MKIKLKYTVFCDGVALQDFDDMHSAQIYSMECKNDNPTGDYKVGIGSYDPLPDMPPSNGT